MEIEKIIEIQYKVLAMSEDLKVDKNSKKFKEFKKRIFENAEYLMSIEEESI